MFLQVEDGGLAHGSNLFHTEFVIKSLINWAGAASGSRILIEETSVLCVGYFASDNVISARNVLRAVHSFFNAKG